MPDTAANAVATCQRCASPLERGDLRCAICAQIAPRRPASRAQVEVQVLRCQGCDAAVSYDARIQAPRCSFCASVMQLESIEDPEEQTGHYLPFTVAPEAARAALKQWLGTLGFFRPPDLKSAARMESLKPIWWVAWIFDARALISWAADSTEGARRSAWAPHAGQVEMVFDDVLVSASRGLSDGETRELTAHYDLRTAGDEPQGADPAEALLEQFDVPRSQARARIVAVIHRVAADRVAARHVPGKTRNVHVGALLRGLETRRYALPAYVLAYRYRDRLYRAVVCGQDDGCVIGQAPYSLARIAGAVVAGLLLVALILAVVLAAVA